MLKISNLRIPLGMRDHELPRFLARKLRLSVDALIECRVLRRALDIRDKRNLHYVYTVGVSVEDEAALLGRNLALPVSRFIPKSLDWPEPGDQPLREPPIVVGAGPAGLFAALFLARHGYQPIVLERGRSVRERIPDVKEFDAGGTFKPESNYLFGEGGAGTFSDGKLTCRTVGAETDAVLRIFAESKGKPSVVYEAKPHLGSNRLPAVVKSLRRQIIEAGGQFQFETRVVDLLCEDGRIRGLRTNFELIPAQVIVLAVGHSARDVYRMLLARNVALSAKPFQMGVRIEQPQINVSRHQYGTPDWESVLGPADYTMKVRAGKNDLFTFCMCAGGYVMPSVSEPGTFCTNGMSRSRHESPFANSGLVTTIDPKELTGTFGQDALVGVRFQEMLEQQAFALAPEEYRVPIQWVHDFLRQQVTGMPPTSYPRGGVSTNLWDWMPTGICEILRVGLPMMDQRWKGIFLRDASLVAPETRGSSPVRIERDRETMQSTNVEGLYPIGEGAGFAGGIVSAAVDGLKAAREIVRRFKPLVR